MRTAPWCSRTHRSCRRRSASAWRIDRHGVRGRRQAVSGAGVPHTVDTIMLWRWSALTKTCASVPACCAAHALPGVASPDTRATLPSARPRSPTRAPRPRSRARAPSRRPGRLRRGARARAGRGSASGARPSPRLSERDERVEVLPTHRAASLLQVVDQLDHPARERQRHAELGGLLECGAEEAVHLRLALPDGEIAPDAGLGLRAGAVVLGDGGQHYRTRTKTKT